MGDTPVTDQYPALVPGNYVVSAGDTLRGIALAVYGDAQLWYLIADANGLQTDAELSVGRNLTIPNKITNLRNAYDTYKPYEPGRIIGDLTPTLPEPPPPPAKKGGGGGCGGIGRILMVVVAIVVAVWTAGASLVAMAPGTAIGASTAGALAASEGFLAVGAAVMGGAGGAVGIGAAMIGGAIGSIASQAVGIALGVQDKFSWGNVALAAIGAGVSAGLAAPGSPLAGPGPGMTVARAMVGNAISQGVGVAVGLQDKFDWKGVAAAGIGAGVSVGLGQILPQATTPFGSLMRETAIGFASGVAKQAVYGGKMNFANVAADAFGNALGSSLAYAAAAGNSAAQQAVALDEAAQQTQGIGPWSEAGYRNGADIESDLAADRRQNPSGWAFADDVARRKVESAWWFDTARNGDVRMPVETNIDAPDSWDLMGKQREVGIVGREGARGAWGIAESLAGEGASTSGINRIKNQLLSLNPELADGVGVGQRYYMPGTDTPEDLALARAADRAYTIQTAAQAATSLNAGYPIDPSDGLRAGPTIERLAFSNAQRLEDARQTVKAYEDFLAFLDRDKPLEAPMFAPDDLIGTGIFKGLAKLGLMGIGMVVRKAESELAESGIFAIARALDGNSRVLTENLVQAGIKVPAGYQSHHLIESHLTRQFEDLFRAAAEHGYNINAAANGLPLPGKQALALADDLPLHRGRHLLEYSNTVKEQLVSLRTAFQSGDVLAAQLPQHLDEISLLMKQRLIDRMVFLTRKDPAYAR